MAKDTTGRLRVTVKSGGRLKLSSKLWLERQLNDPYVAKAKRDGLRSRAAYKLIEIDDKHHFLKRGATVVVESTVYPGCTEEDCVPVLERHVDREEVVARMPEHRIKGLLGRAEGDVKVAPQRVQTSGIAAGRMRPRPHRGRSARQPAGHGSRTTA